MLSDAALEEDLSYGSYIKQFRISCMFGLKFLIAGRRRLNKVIKVKFLLTTGRGWVLEEVSPLLQKASSLLKGWSLKMQPLVDRYPAESHSQGL